MDQSLDHIKSAIADLEQKILKFRNESIVLNEEQTKHYLINPLINALGWRLDDFDQVRLEVPMKMGNNKVDYALFIQNKSVLLIEAKSLGTQLNDALIADVSRYPQNFDLRWCLLTDGNAYILIDGKANTNNRIVWKHILTEIDESGLAHLSSLTPLKISCARFEDESLKPRIKYHWQDWMTGGFRGDPRKIIRDKLAQDGLCEDTDSRILITISEILKGINLSKLVKEESATFPETKGQLEIQLLKGRSEKRSAAFFNDLDEYGFKVFKKIIEFAQTNSLLIKWGKKGFSLNVLINGEKVNIIYGYPLKSVFKQSIYTAFSEIKRKVNNSYLIVEEYDISIKKINDFKQAGKSGYKLIINKDINYDNIEMLLQSIDKIAALIRSNGIKQ